tara:strand:- start:122 stop:598 length:477 start_codon:yes stop_codon:yes gene_type:complete
MMISIISSCSSNEIISNPVTKKKSKPGLFSKNAEKGISLSDILNPKDKDGISVNVNGYLWRASLDVLSVAPLISTDALGGTIITDWYVNKNIKDKRIKITAYIKTSELRSDGVSVKVHVQKLESGIWTNTYTDNKLASQIENNILNEARNYRINSLNK